ncbi:MAG: NAD(P)/FAD-dependent oxidoreductase [Candidatus Kerfeldbacteria bacterium]|nr:NAD(P)/FAD-dependent oxidoreductase [Candidatus Kerfeldbacteria bacterium]
MTRADYCIVGGGVAGTTAAETLRQHDGSASIVILSDEPYRLYSRILLSKPAFFLEKVPFEQIFLKSEQWYKDHTIDLLAGHAAVALDVGQKIVTLDDRRTIGYGKLLLAIGTSVVRWKIPGSDLPGVHYLRNLEDARGITADVKTAQHAAVIGGGFVGFEMCDMLKQANVNATLIIRERYFWEPVLDETSGRMIEAALTKGGVQIIHEALTDRVEGTDHVTGLKLNNGTTIPCDMVMVGIGTRSHVDWVKAAGITCDDNIVTNEFLETNAKDVWAAGDIAEYHDVILDEKIRLGNWTNALMQGRTAALNMLGQRKPYKLVSFYSAHGLGMAITFVGDTRVTEKTAVIARGSPEHGWYSRYMMKGEKMMGATMVNRTQDLTALTRIIENSMPIGRYRQQLADSAFDLASIVAAHS